MLYKRVSGLLGFLVMIWVELVFKICNQDSQKFPNLPVYLFSAWTTRQTNNCVLLWGICWSICRNFPSNTLYLLIFWLMRMAPRASNYGTQLCFNVLKAPVLLIFTAMMFIPSVYFRKRETSRYAAVAICVQSTIKCLHLVYSLFLRVSTPMYPSTFQLPRVILCGVDWGSRD